MSGLVGPNGTDAAGTSPYQPTENRVVETPDPASGELTGRPSSRDVTAVYPELALYPDIVAALRRAYESPSRKLDLVLTDLDNTFLPGAGNSQEEFDRGVADARRLTELLDTHNGILVSVTGSSWDVSTTTTPSVSHRIETGHIPSFLHAVVTDGGMRAFGKGGGRTYQEDSHYGAFLSDRKAGFGAQQIFEVASFVRDLINDAELASEIGLKPIDFDMVARVDPSSPRDRAYFQPHVHPHGVAAGAKVCLYFYANSLEDRDQIERQFRKELSQYAIVCCEERDFNNAAHTLGDGEEGPRKFCLDITPVHKGTPVKYFSALVKKAADYLHREYPGNSLEISTWYCGDAANDLVGMRRQEVKNVVMVSRSSEELRRHANDLASAGKSVYVENDQSCTGAGSIMKALLHR